MANMFDENGNYNKTEWKPGDRITAGKLNKIEESLEAINNNDIERHKEADERLDALEEQKEAVNDRFDELEDLVADNKTEVEVLIYENNVKMDRLEQEMNDGIDEVHNVAETVDGKIADADASMKAQVNQGKTDMEAMVAEVEGELEGLHAKDDELSSQLAQSINDLKSWVDVHWFICDDGEFVKGDGVHDDTTGIQRAIDYASENNISEVRFRANTYMIKVDKKVDNIQSWVDRYIGIRCKSNVNLNLNGAILKAIPTNSTNYLLLDVVHCSNTKIYGGSIIGERTLHLGTSGEWGHLISIQNSTNIEVFNMALSEAWGDGIYISNEFPGEKLKNIKISNCIIDNNRRQGISVSGGEFITIDGCVISRTNGSSPQSGIDIEPDTGYSSVKNITISNCKFYDNEGRSIESWLTDGYAFDNLVVENCIFDDGDSSKTSSVNLRSGKNVRFTNNTNCRLYLQYLENICITNTDINKNMTGVWLYLDGIKKANISNNNINTDVRLTECIRLIGETEDITIQNNKISNILFGIIMHDNSSHSSIEIIGNVFNNCTEAIYSYSGSNVESLTIANNTFSNISNYASYVLVNNINFVNNVMTNMNNNAKYIYFRTSNRGDCYFCGNILEAPLDSSSGSIATFTTFNKVYFTNNIINNGSSEVSAFYMNENRNSYVANNIAPMLKRLGGYSSDNAKIEANNIIQSN